MQRQVMRQATCNLPSLCRPQPPQPAGEAAAYTDWQPEAFLLNAVGADGSDEQAQAKEALQSQASSRPWFGAAKRGSKQQIGQRPAASILASPRMSIAGQAQMGELGDGVMSAAACMSSPCAGLDTSGQDRRLSATGAAEQRRPADGHAAVSGGADGSAAAEAEAPGSPAAGQEEAQADLHQEAQHSDAAAPGVEDAGAVENSAAAAMNQDDGASGGGR